MSARIGRMAAIVLSLALVAACGKAPPYVGGDVAELQIIEVQVATGRSPARGR